MKSSKKFIFFTAMLFFTFTIILSIGEIGMRVFHLVPPITNLYKIFISDPVLPYKTNPFLKLHQRSETGEFVYDIETNSFGFRDVEHTEEKNGNVFRILGLGDSFTFGAGAQLEETFLYTLETMLNQRVEKQKKVEIIKAGVPRYFPETERLLLQHYGKKYNPDLILVGFLPNDVSDTHEGIDAVAVDPSGFLTSREAKSLGRIGVFLYSNSYVCRYALKKYISYRALKQNRPRGDWNEIYKPNGFYEKDWQTVELEYQKMVKIAAELKARELCLFIFPKKGHGIKLIFILLKDYLHLQWNMMRGFLIYYLE